MTAIDRGRLATGPRLGRRELLRLGGLGLGWLGAGQPILGAGAATGVPPDRSVILLLLIGGPSQLETWDPKPDAPSEVRGPFGSIATRVPGVRISEHLPRLAARMDRLAIVRSVHHEEAPIHETGCQLLQTGRLCKAGEQSPHFGSVVAKLLGARNDRPPSVLLPGPIQSTGIDIPHGQSAAWLGPGYAPLRLDAGPDGPDFDPRLFLRRCGESEPRSSAAAGNPFDLAAEPASVRETYGETTFGACCLVARRLVEVGVRVVTVNMFQTVFNRITWDCHGGAPFSTLDDYAHILLPELDHAFGALIDDLDGRGRLESTLVIAAGEFGRTPRINSAGGRDHWPGVWSIAMAGGGIRGGQVLGASDQGAGYPADRPVSPQDVLASIYFSLGVDAAQYLARPGGEPFALVEDGRAIRELFG
jgi:hypothetical protein